MERIINYRDIPTDKKTDVLNALEQIGFFPAYGGVKTMQRVMEKSVPGSGPQFYFVFREDKLIGYNFLIGDTKRYNLGNGWGYEMTPAELAKKDEFYSIYWSEYNLVKESGSSELREMPDYLNQDRPSFEARA